METRRRAYRGMSPEEFEALAAAWGVTPEEALEILADPELAQITRMLADPKQALIDFDRELVEREGLRGFTKLAWGTIEREGTYKSNWHIDAVCEHLEAVSAGQIHRLGIAVPPRHMKSLSSAVMWPAWDWLANPWRRFLFSSYAQNLSIRDSLKCRRVIQSPWFQARWGDRVHLVSDQNTKSRFENTAGGYRLSTSVKGQLTGEGGDVVVVDDAHNSTKAESEKERESTLRWWDEAMSTRLNDPANGAFVVIMQRLHSRDLMGHILQREGVVEKGGKWTYLCLPARYEPDHPHVWIRDPRKEPGELLWPEHLPKATLDALETALGPYAAAGQLQQRPAPREGGMFKAEWFKPVPTYAPDTKWWRAWDLAATEKSLTKADPDFTAGVLIGFSESRGKWIFGHVDWFRANPSAVYAKMRHRADLDRVTYGYHQIFFPQDPGQAGKAQIDAISKALASHSFSFETVKGDKVMRATPLSAQAEAGNVEILYPEGEGADRTWQDNFLVELSGFPNGAHDDQVDAASAGFYKLTGGTDGLIEYYKRKLAKNAAGDAAAAEAAKRAQTEVQVGPPLVIVHAETNNLARAYLGMKGRPGEEKG